MSYKCRPATGNHMCPLRLAVLPLALVAASSFVLSGDVRADPFTAAQIDFFERRIRPLLIEQCGACHGAEKQEGGLRLDRRDAILQGGDRGVAMVAGNPDQSLLMRAVSYEADDLAMPPDGKLAQQAIEDLRQWILQRAPWPSQTPSKQRPSSARDTRSHWAFQRIRTPTIPPFQDNTWARNAIDHFVLARLERAGLSPSPPAAAGTLIRRAYFDLLGLPPSFEEVEAFCESPDRVAFQRLIDKLLSNHHYGKRWARHWLDVARYADTKGYVDGGQVRFAFAYTYRDYVVRALNEDLPFDQFVVDQLAADHVAYEPEDRWRLAGIGFLTVGRRFNHNYHDILDDQIDVISRGLQGVSVTCARCHDHKYDPIPTADYYSLYGILASSFEPQHADLPIVSRRAAMPEPAEYQMELRKRAAAYETKFDELWRQIQHELRAFSGDYLVYLVQESPKHRQAPQNPLKTARTVLRGPTAYGFGAIRRWRDYLRARDENDPVFGIWHQMDAVASASFAAELERCLARDDFNPRLREKLREQRPTSMVELARAYGELFETTYARARKAPPTSQQRKPVSDAAEEALLRVLYAVGSPPAVTRFESIDCYHLDEHTSMRNLAGKVEELSVETSSAAPRAMVLRDRVLPYAPVVFRRGQPNRPGPAVPRQIPTIFSAADAKSARAAGQDRAALAQAAVSPHNPLTARVLVNRVWQWHFGKPLVQTPSDFGVRGAPPSHPELLDYLASWLIENDWSLKKLHRLIMNSSTYQQSSRYRSECASVDAENALLWRFNARRLQWEAIRDALLAVSGRLVNRPGGRSVALRPDDPQSQCRTLYLAVDRQDISRFARNFDFPSPDFTSPQRPTTTVPQQQLFFLNSPFVWKQAETLGRQAMQRADADDVGRFRYLYRTVLARDPRQSREEVEALLKDLRGHLARGENSKLWTVVAHTLLQTSAFVYLE